MSEILDSYQITLIALTLEQMRLFRDDRAAFASNLGYPGYTPEKPNPDLAEALPVIIKQLEERPQDWPWGTNWAIVLKAEQTIIGGIGLHGLPNAAGEVELGYGLDSPYRHRGFAVPAIHLLTGWAFSHTEVMSLVAETLIENLPSQRALQRAGFIPERVEGGSLWWRMPRPVQRG
ncbi:MAG: GNAT family N-acetyltransferase [Chloroflexi bacterium]|nr:GNAT family N-acetyltransferase [Chloroflexota bacterium]